MSFNVDLDILLTQESRAPDVFKPTSFWRPGVKMLINDIKNGDFTKFKEWRSSLSYFYPSYGQGYTIKDVDKIWDTVCALQLRTASRPWLNQQLLGAAQAHRDLDVAMARWNQARWPFDFEQSGESNFGGASRTYALFGVDKPRYSKAVLHYMMALSELSNHVDAPPRHFLELGAGYGSLGEIVLTRDTDATFTDVDIPPTLLIAANYIAELIGEAQIRRGWLETNANSRARAEFVPPWNFPKLEKKFDVFVNTYSFHEMEPHVVENYINIIARIRPKFVVSLNSHAGKARNPAEDASEFAVAQQVASPFIEEKFRLAGYELLSRRRRPLAPAQAELLIMAAR